MTKLTVALLALATLALPISTADADSCQRVARAMRYHEVNINNAMRLHGRADDVMRRLTWARERAVKVTRNSKVARCLKRSPAIRKLNRERLIPALNRLAIAFDGACWSHGSFKHTALFKAIDDATMRLDLHRMEGLADVFEAELDRDPMLRRCRPLRRRLEQLQKRASSAAKP